LFSAPKDEDNGYRAFDENDIYKIWSITYHRNIDMSVSDIYRLKNSDAHSLTDIYDMVQHQKGDLLTLIEEYKRKLAVWEFYEVMTRKAMRWDEPPQVVETGAFHLFYKESFYDSTQSLFPISNPCSIFMMEEESNKNSVREYCLVFDDDMHFISAEDLKDEIRTIPSFPALSVVERIEGNFDEKAVLIKAIERARNTGYQVKPPYYAVYLLSSGSWTQAVRYYEVFLPLKKAT
jgi:DNA-binding transcriptional MerR regulator